MNIKSLDLKDPRNRIVLPLDVSSIEEITQYVSLLKEYVGFFKIGFQLIHSVGGPQAIKAVKNAGGRVFYDCKLYDIPETMKKSATDISKLGVDIFNVHASSGVKAMKWVRDVSGSSIVSAVTVLTSSSDEECQHTYNKDVREKVTSFALDIVESGISSIICSASEAGIIKNVLGLKDQLLITPGIRPLWAATDDQDPDRIMTPYKAIMAGSDLLVIGRPILNPPSTIGGPVQAAIAIAEEIRQALWDMAA
jgi:orotidine-5'-phosphate decarboxylase